MHILKAYLSKALWERQQILTRSEVGKASSSPASPTYLARLYSLPSKQPKKIRNRHNSFVCELKGKERKAGVEYMRKEGGACWQAMSSCTMEMSEAWNQTTPHNLSLEGVKMPLIKSVSQFR